jgi:hypothetical protein
MRLAGYSSGAGCTVVQPLWSSPTRADLPCPQRGGTPNFRGVGPPLPITFSRLFGDPGLLGGHRGTSVR